VRVYTPRQPSRESPRCRRLEPARRRHHFIIDLKSWAAIRSLMWVAEVRYFICADTIVELATRTLELLGLGLFITTEYWMPGRTGYELLKHVNLNPPHTNPAMSSALRRRAAMSDARRFQLPRSTLRTPPLSSKHTWPSATAS
jgi:hypothetical protein